MSLVTREPELRACGGAWSSLKELRCLWGRQDYGSFWNVLSVFSWNASCRYVESKAVHCCNMYMCNTNCYVVVVFSLWYFDHILFAYLMYTMLCIVLCVIKVMYMLSAKDFLRTCWFLCAPCMERKQMSINLFCTFLLYYHICHGFRLLICVFSVFKFVWSHCVSILKTTYLLNLYCLIFLENIWGPKTIHLVVLF